MDVICKEQDERYEICLGVLMVDLQSNFSLSLKLCLPMKEIGDRFALKLFSQTGRIP